MPETLSLYHHLPALFLECQAVGYMAFESLPALWVIQLKTVAMRWYNPVGQSFEACYFQGNICSSLDLI